jgi:hypothetical protein
LRGVGAWVGPVFVVRASEIDAGGSDPQELELTFGHIIGLSLGLMRLDFAPSVRQPSAARVVIASCLATVGSLVADALLVVVGTTLFPATRDYGHFHFSDYAKLTVVGVLVACIAWPVVTRLTSRPRSAFFRSAVVVTMVLFLPDLYLLYKGQRVDAVGVLMCMHVAIAIVVYNALVRIAPAGSAASQVLVS